VFLDSVLTLDGNVLEAIGGTDVWEFRLRFPTHGVLSEFQQACFEAESNSMSNASTIPPDPTQGRGTG